MYYNAIPIMPEIVTALSVVQHSFVVVLPRTCKGSGESGVDIPWNWDRYLHINPRSGSYFGTVRQVVKEAVSQAMKEWELRHGQP
jgi:hypothetical protein